MGSYDATLRIYTVSAELYFESRFHKVSIEGCQINRIGSLMTLSGPNIRNALLEGREMARYCQFGQHSMSLGRREETEAYAIQTSR